LAGIIAHELGHIYGNHHKHALIKNYFIESLWSMIDKGTVAQIIKNITQDLLTQEDELEADHLAIKSLRDQHINPMGVVAFFEHRKKVEHPVLRYLSFTHPDYDKRIAIFNQHYDSYPVLSPNKWEKLKQACQ
jgi:predicted Zn-dependent protease